MRDVWHPFSPSEIHFLIVPACLEAVDPRGVKVGMNPPGFISQVIGTERPKPDASVLLLHSLAFERSVIHLIEYRSNPL